MLPFPRDINYAGLIEKAMCEFFPGGKASVGRSTAMDFGLSTNHNLIEDTPSFKLDDLFDRYGSRTRIYLTSKKKNVVPVCIVY